MQRHGCRAALPLPSSPLFREGPTPAMKALCYEEQIFAAELNNVKWALEFERSCEGGSE